MARRPGNGVQVVTAGIGLVTHRISCSFTISLVTTTRTRDRQPRSHVSRGTSCRPKWTRLSLCVHSCRSTTVWSTCPSSLRGVAAVSPGSPCSLPCSSQHKGRSRRRPSASGPDPTLKAQPRLAASAPPAATLTLRAPSGTTRGSSGGSFSRGAWYDAHE